MSSADPLTAFLDLVRTAACEGTTQALASRAAGASTTGLVPLLDKRSLAHALGVSTATVDRLVRQRRIPYVPVGEVRRFDLDAVREALAAHREEPEQAAGSGPDLARGAPPVPGIRLLSRGSRK